MAYISALKYRVLRKTQINILVSHNIITFHKDIGIIDFNDKATSSNFYFNKNQIKIIASDLNEESVKNNQSLYMHDTVMLTKQQENKLYEKKYEQREELQNMISRFEREEDAHSRPVQVKIAEVYLKQDFQIFENLDGTGKPQ